jgi:hypothetical protein
MQMASMNVLIPAAFISSQGDADLGFVMAIELEPLA